MTSEPRTDTPGADTATLKSEYERLRLEAATLKLRGTVRRLKESSALYGLDWVTPWKLAYERMGTPDGWLPVNNPASRRHGAYFPFFQTEQELGFIRETARLICATNNHAAGLLNGLTSFVIGTGFKFKATMKDETAEKKPADDLTEFLDKWAAANDWNERQQEAFGRTREDGECFLRFFADDGVLKVRFVWPEQITQPPGTTFEEWGFGIRCDPHDAEKVLEYYVADLNNPAADGEFVPAEEMVHLKANSRTGIKRGLSDFAFDTKDTLDAAARLTKNMGEGSAIREAIAYIREHEAAGEEEVQEFVSTQADFTEPKPPSMTTRRNVTQMTPGTVEDVPKGLTHKPPPANDGTPAHVTVVDVLLRSGGVRHNAPEWLSSGNANNMGAYTSSTVAESPFVRGIVRLQEYSRVRYLMIVTKAVRTAEACGELPPGTLAACTLDLVPPTPETRNKLEEAQRASVEIPLGVDSRNNYCSAQGRDFDRILADNQQYQDEHGGMGSPLPLPGDPGPGPGAGARTGPTIESLADGLARMDATLRRLVEHGPAPRPGLVFDEASHRWVKPNAGNGNAGGGSGSGGGTDERQNRIVAAVQRLDEYLSGSQVGGAYKGAKKLVHRVESGMAVVMRRTQAIAMQAARERGLPEDHVARVGKVLAAADFALSFAASKGTIAATGSVGAGYVAGMMPTASVGYLLYSTARNPAATLRAAAKYVKGQLDVHPHESLQESDGMDEAGLVLDYFSVAEDVDWAEAVLYVALDQTGGNVAKAVSVAKAVLENQPHDVEESDTGIQTDSAGRRYRMVDGKRVHIAPEPPQSEIGKRLSGYVDWSKVSDEQFAAMADEIRKLPKDELQRIAGGRKANAETIISALSDRRGIAQRNEY